MEKKYNIFPPQTHLLILKNIRFFLPFYWLIFGKKKSIGFGCFFFNLFNQIKHILHAKTRPNNKRKTKRNEREEKWKETKEKEREKSENKLEFSLIYMLFYSFKIER